MAVMTRMIAWGGGCPGGGVPGTPPAWPWLCLHSVVQKQSPLPESAVLVSPGRGSPFLEWSGSVPGARLRSLEEAVHWPLGGDCLPVAQQ